ncbi:hypothetical protein T281_16760 [Rhodomicrobium udaipurense JA643]|nr:hypothetical protein T281_16760 [Rhodomicrobium udaipurense JA643]
MECLLDHFTQLALLLARQAAKLGKRLRINLHQKFFASRVIHAAPSLCVSLRLRFQIVTFRSMNRYASDRHLNPNAQGITTN